MATQNSRSAARLMMAPAVILLLGWMLVPLVMTLIFSFKKASISLSSTQVSPGGPGRASTYCLTLEMPALRSPSKSTDRFAFSKEACVTEMERMLNRAKEISR